MNVLATTCMKSKIIIWGIPAIAVLYGIGQATGLLSSSEPTSKPPASPVAVTCPSGTESGEWVRTAGSFWSGVKVYTGNGSCKQHLATIYGGNSSLVLLDYVSGDRDWKDRDAVAKDTWVNRNDPAIAQRNWREIASP